MELMLREKDFREFVKGHDWAQYAGKNVAITCTADAIVPAWAYMLLANRLAPYAAKLFLAMPQFWKLYYLKKQWQIWMLSNIATSASL